MEKNIRINLPLPRQEIIFQMATRSAKPIDRAEIDELINPLEPHFGFSFTSYVGRDQRLSASLDLWLHRACQPEPNQFDGLFEYIEQWTGRDHGLDRRLAAFARGRWMVFGQGGESCEYALVDREGKPWRPKIFTLDTNVAPDVGRSRWLERTWINLHEYSQLAQRPKWLRQTLPKRGEQPVQPGMHPGRAMQFFYIEEPGISTPDFATCLVPRVTWVEEWQSFMVNDHSADRAFVAFIMGGNFHKLIALLYASEQQLRTQPIMGGERSYIQVTDTSRQLTSGSPSPQYEPKPVEAKPVEKPAAKAAPTLTLPTAPAIGTNLGAKLSELPIFTMPRVGDPIEGKPNRRHTERTLGELRKKMKKTHLVVDAQNSAPPENPAPESATASA